MSKIEYILTHSTDDYTLFITFEYLNKIFLTDKGFDNYPFRKPQEKPSYSIYKVENSSEIKDESEEIIPYKELIYLGFEFLKNKGSFVKKAFLINSVCNMIANIFRIIWLELRNPAVLLNKVVDDFMRNVIFIYKNTN